MARRRPRKALNALAILAPIAMMGALAGCPGDGGSTGEPGARCETDRDCGDLSCTRDRVCEPDDQIRRLQIRWTLNAQPAGATSCQGIASLSLSFNGPGDTSFGFADVLCSIGVFTIDRMSMRFDRVTVTALDTHGGTLVGVEAAITSDETVAVDLPIPLP